MANSAFQSFLQNMEIHYMLYLLSKSCCESQEARKSESPPAEEAKLESDAPLKEDDSEEVAASHQNPRKRDKAKQLFKRMSQKFSNTSEPSIPSSLSAPQLSATNNNNNSNSQTNDFQEPIIHKRTLSVIDLVKKVKHFSFTKMKNSTPVFPTKIWLEIIDHVKDKKTLAALSLMNKPIRNEVGKRMLNKVIIKDEGNELAKLDILAKFAKQISILKINFSAMNPGGLMSEMLKAIKDSGRLDETQFRLLESTHSIDALSPARGLQTKILYAYVQMLKVGIAPAEVQIDLGPDFLNASTRYLLFQYFCTVAQAIYPTVDDMRFPAFMVVKIVSDGNVIHNAPWFGHHFLHSNPPPGGQNDGSVTDYCPFPWRFEPYGFCREVGEMFPGHHSFNHLLHNLAGEPCPKGIVDPVIDDMIRGVVVEPRELQPDPFLEDHSQQNYGDPQQDDDDSEQSNDDSEQSDDGSGVCSDDDSQQSHDFSRVYSDDYSTI